MSTEPVAPAPSTGAIADLPGGEPIPNPAGDHQPTPKPAPIPLGALLAATPSNLDAFLAHLNRCMSTPTGIDTTLLFAGYTARLAGSALAALSRSALRRSAREWVVLVAALPPRATVLFGADSALPTTAAAATALSLAGRLRALSALLSEVRTMLRLWGLLGMYFWARGLVQKTLQARRARREQQSGGAATATTTTTITATASADEKTAAVAAAPADPAPQMTGVDAAISYTQLALCVCLQALENGSFLSSRGVLGWSPEAQGRAGLWSARLWGAYIGIELGRLAAEGAGAVSPKAPDADSWRSQVVRNLAWAPLTVHWGSEKGLVSDWVVGLLACIPGTIQMRQLWKDTA